MGCRFVYAFIPEDSYDALLRERAVVVAKRILERVDHTMSLEAQEGIDLSKEKRVKELADDLISTLSRDLWKEPS